MADFSNPSPLFWFEGINKDAVWPTGFCTVCLGLSFPRFCSSHCIWALPSAVWSHSKQAASCGCRIFVGALASTSPHSRPVAKFSLFFSTCHADYFKYWLCTIAVCQYVDVLCLLYTSIISGSMTSESTLLTTTPRCFYMTIMSYVRPNTGGWQGTQKEMVLAKSVTASPAPQCALWIEKRR